MIDFVYAIPVKAVNREGVTANGLEYQFRWKPFEELSINGNYAYLNMWDRDGEPILYRSEHSGQFHFNFHSNACITYCITFVGL